VVKSAISNSYWLLKRNRELKRDREFEREREREREQLSAEVGQEQIPRLWGAKRKGAVGISAGRRRYSCIVNVVDVLYREEEK
jgi:hypothetical protein